MGSHNSPKPQSEISQNPRTSPALERALLHLAPRKLCGNGQYTSRAFIFAVARLPALKTQLGRVRASWVFLGENVQLNDNLVLSAVFSLLNPPLIIQWHKRRGGVIKYFSRAFGARYKKHHKSLLTPLNPLAQPAIALWRSQQ